MYTLPCRKTEMTFDLLPGMKGTVVHSQSMPPLFDVPAVINKALVKPVNSASLKKKAKKEVWFALSSPISRGLALITC